MPCADPQGGREEVVGGHGEGEVRQQRGEKMGLLVLWVAQGAAKEKGCGCVYKEEKRLGLG